MRIQSQSMIHSLTNTLNLNSDAHISVCALRYDVPLSVADELRRKHAPSPATAQEKQTNIDDDDDFQPIDNELAKTLLPPTRGKTVRSERVLSIH